MASTFTTNKALDKQGAGDNVGTWGTPLNSDIDIVDQALGTTQVISLAAGSVTLSTAQARSPFLIFTGALPSNVTVTIPGLSTSPGTVVSGGFYTVLNQTSNSSVRIVTLATTVAGQEVIACPPGESFDAFVLGTNSSQAGSIKFRNLGRVGSYWDFMGSSVPAWVTACTVPPYLYCNGTTFSSAVYPILATIMGTVTLPDTRGRGRFSYNDGQFRITSAVSGVNGDARFASGGSQNMMAHTHGITDPGHDHTVPRAGNDLNNVAVTGANIAAGTAGATTGSNTTGITINSEGSGGSENMPPAYIGGITLVRAA